MLFGVRPEGDKSVLFSIDLTTLRIKTIGELDKKKWSRGATSIPVSASALHPMETASLTRWNRIRRICGCCGDLPTPIARAPGVLKVRQQIYPRPMNGILVAITVINSTLASKGRFAM